MLVSLGVLWWTGDVGGGAVIGVICGSAAAFTVGAAGTERSIDRRGRIRMNYFEEAQGGCSCASIYSAVDSFHTSFDAS